MNVNEICEENQDWRRFFYWGEEFPARSLVCARMQLILSAFASASLVLPRSPPSIHHPNRSPPPPPHRRPIEVGLSRHRAIIHIKRELESAHHLPPAALFIYSIHLLERSIDAAVERPLRSRKGILARLIFSGGGGFSALSCLACLLPDVYTADGGCARDVVHR